MITADPLAWYQPDRRQMGPENYDDMVAAINSPAKSSRAAASSRPRFSTASRRRARGFLAA